MNYKKNSYSNKDILWNLILCTLDTALLDRAWISIMQYYLLLTLPKHLQENKECASPAILAELLLSITWR